MMTTRAIRPKSEVLNAARDRAGGFKVNVSRGERIGRVSSEWFSRPADERYLSLSDLFAAVHGRSERRRTQTVESAAIRVEASRDDAESLATGIRRLGLSAPAVCAGEAGLHALGDRCVVASTRSRDQPTTCLCERRSHSKAWLRCRRSSMRRSGRKRAPDANQRPARGAA